MAANREHLLGLRVTRDFIKELDSVCDDIGYNRSEILRFLLKNFVSEHKNNEENMAKIRLELF